MLWGAKLSYRIEVNGWLEAAQELRKVRWLRYDIYRAASKQCRLFNLMGLDNRCIIETVSSVSVHFNVVGIGNVRVGISPDLDRERATRLFRAAARNLGADVKYDGPVAMELGHLVGLYMSQKAR